MLRENPVDHPPRRALARSSVASVEVCDDCGVVHLHVGAVTLRLTRASIQDLQRVVTEACCELLRADEQPALALAMRRAAPGVARGLA